MCAQTVGGQCATKSALLDQTTRLSARWVMQTLLIHQDEGGIELLDLTTRLSARCMMLPLHYGEVVMWRCDEEFRVLLGNATFTF